MNKTKVRIANGKEMTLEEFERAADTIEQMRDVLDMDKSTALKLQKESVRLQQENSRLQKALEFYRDADYKAEHPWCWRIGKEDKCIMCDEGKIAREAVRDE